MHGFLDSGTTWIANFPHQSLGFLLADAGYDVWIGNFRGNMYSKEHVKLRTDSKEFWDFSFDEMAAYDLPAMIDYALEKSRQKSLFYVGHSMGTLTAFAKFSSNPEFSKKIKQFFALAPVITTVHVKGALGFLKPVRNQIGRVLELFGVNQFMPKSYVVDLISKYVCGFWPTESLICKNMFFLVSGTDTGGLNASRLAVYATHTPSGTSAKTAIHMSQLCNGEFQKFDYGKIGNLKHYRQSTPLKYDVSSMTVPVALFWGQKDWVATPQDTAALISQLTSIVANYPYPDMNHFDFVLGKHAAKWVYEPVMRMMANFQ